MPNLGLRQRKILDLMQRQGSASNKEIAKLLKGLSRFTIVRELDILRQKGFIEKIGQGRNTRYREKVMNNLLRYIDPDRYFAKGPDQRKVAFPVFNFSVFDNLEKIFSPDEYGKLDKLNRRYRQAVKRLPAAVVQKEFERLTIELSWKSSQIEGNTYSLIDTEALIKENKEARGHKKEEAIMILNHKKALDYIADKRSDFKKLTLAKIANVHRLLVADLDVETNFRKSPVGITGTVYKPLDNEHQIREALEKTVKAVNAADDPFSKSLLVMIFISYIQPFVDGNKRTARLLGDALLLAWQAAPLSFRSVDEGEYKKATLLFYERNNLRLFKELFMDQFRFSVENYFLINEKTPGQHSG